MKKFLLSIILIILVVGMMACQPQEIVEGFEKITLNEAEKDFLSSSKDYIFSKVIDENVIDENVIKSCSISNGPEVTVETAIGELISDSEAEINLVVFYEYEDGSYQKLQFIMDTEHEELVSYIKEQSQKASTKHAAPNVNGGPWTCFWVKTGVLLACLHATPDGPCVETAELAYRICRALP